MGLDITAYRKLTPAPDAQVDDDGELVEWDKYLHVRQGTVDWTEQNWPGRTDGVSPGIYTYADAEGFRAGAYSAYNRWRDNLAKLAGYPLGQYKQYDRNWDSHCVACWNGAEGPFSELINFADNEGMIGPSVAKKLAKDFADFQTAADAVDDQFFRTKYAEWRKAFEMAADGGAVEFH